MSDPQQPSQNPQQMPHQSGRRYRPPAMPEITGAVKREWRSRRLDHSAGGVAWRKVEGVSVAPQAGQDIAAQVANAHEVALIATRGGTRWQLPKGTREEGEASEETARREVEEEVGLRTEVDAFLRTIEYWYWDTWQRAVPMLVQKRVDCYLLRVTGGELSDESFEVDATGWFTLQQASEVLTFKGEREVIADAIAWLAQQA